MCIGAHCDDIEIGCGGTVLRMISEYNIARLIWIVFTSNEERKTEALKSAGLFLEDAGTADVRVLEFQDGFLPASWSEIKGYFNLLKKEHNPDVIFTHCRDDLHQDHRLINEFTWNTFRNHLILEYEIPKYDGDLGKPNLFTPLNSSIKERKLQIINECFGSQHSKHWFDPELLTSLMRIRGMESVSGSGYAEAFYSRKIVL